MTSDDDAEVRSIHACQRLKWPFRILTIVIVPFWLIAGWAALFLAAMAGGAPSPRPWPLADYFFNFIILSVVALAIPVAGLLLGLRGEDKKQPALMLAGILILFAWLGTAAGWYGWSRIQGSTLTNPGNWADRDFKIPPEDRAAYKMLRHGKTLSVVFPSVKQLFPDAPLGTRSPTMAEAEIRGLTLRGITVLPGQVCQGKLNEFRFTDETRNGENPGVFRDLFGVTLSEFKFFLSGQKDWIASCNQKGPSFCKVIFVNGDWVSEFALSSADLCKAPEMNQRFVGLIEKWRR